MESCHFRYFQMRTEGYQLQIAGLLAEVESYRCSSWGL